VGAPGRWKNAATQCGRAHGKARPQHNDLESAMTTLLLQGPTLTASAAEAMASNLGARCVARRDHWVLHEAGDIDAGRLARLRAQVSFDINMLPQAFHPGAVRLLVSDMDSTLISIECVDEIADFIGVKPQVAAITAAAMRGEIDFATSLTRRIALLQGLKQEALEHVYHERLRLNPGAEKLLAGLRSREIHFALVSGGFTFFTDRLKERLQIDFTLANELEIVDGRLTGQVIGDIVGAQAKAEYLRRLCTDLGISSTQTIAVGDGANDLQMLEAAGLGVAYHAKEVVQEQADIALNHSGLDGILALLEDPV
jgi:phosphoserine phosphatase